VLGFWGLFFLVPIMREIEIKIGVTPYGVGILTASIILAFMIFAIFSFNWQGCYASCSKRAQGSSFLL
jgi:ABC-type phosphate transport system permease subunit